MARGREYRFDRAFVPSLNSGVGYWSPRGGPLLEHGVLPTNLISNRAVCINAHVNSRDIIKALHDDGWVEVAQKGSHKQFRHPAKAGRVTVPHPKRDFPIATLRSIERQAQISLR